MDVLAQRYLGLDRFPYPEASSARVVVKIRPEKVRHRDAPDLSQQDIAPALQLHRTQVRALLDKDMNAWVDTFAEDAVLEFPFAPVGNPGRLEGKSAIREYVKDYTKHIDLRSFSELTVHPTVDPEVLVIEAQADARVIATGKPYPVRYVWVIVVRGGKVVRQRDYWNPLAVTDALGGDEAVRNTFNIAPEH